MPCNILLETGWIILVKSILMPTPTTPTVLSLLHCSQGGTALDLPSRTWDDSGTGKACIFLCLDHTQLLNSTNCDQVPQDINFPTN